MKSNKVKSLSEVVRIARRAKSAGKKIVTTNGTFDVLHVGHVRNLESAKSYGDILIVGINSDSSVRAYKGKGRPVIPDYERAEVIASLKPVDFVFIFESRTPIPWLQKINPHVHVKGADRKISEIIEKPILDKLGAKLKLVPYHKGKSTSGIIAKIKKL